MAKKRILPEKYKEQAEKLAERPYSVIVKRDRTPKGDPIYLAINQELDGCMTHGRTSEEAIKNLRDARVDYLQVCLLTGTPIPVPAACEELYTSPSEVVTAETNYTVVRKGKLDQLIIEIAQPEKREMITEFAFRVLTTSDA